MPTLVDAFLLGWRLCRQRGQVAHVIKPNMTPHGIFAEMTMPAREDVQAMLDIEFPPPENKPLGEHSIG